ncbi:ATP-binding protein [Odoribacter lunatus]|uniref:ATP-binding protein n=1 Tax=Odoribacter lunatus TaxID=2941335 RepID=UPI00203BC280|nr:AAA family ATPase [Odoribacter lunatus]
MLYRKIGKYIEEHLKPDTDRILVLEGARQIGKSYIIREVGKRLYKNFVEVNFVADDEGRQLFKHVHTTEEFYLTLSMVAGERLDSMENTLVFLDEVQHYPQYLTMLKFFRQERRYRFIASGSLLGIALRSTTSIPVGSIIRKEMFQLDFEEFLIANGFGAVAIAMLREKYEKGESLSEEQHGHVMDLFRRYLLVGGMPDAVNEYVASHNIVRVREVQNAIRVLYGDDASKYEQDNGRHLLIRRIYDMVPSQMENKKKRIVAKDIQGRKSDRFSRYREEFEYLISSGITLDVRAISNPRCPLTESVQKNLLKLYLNDVGMLTSQLYHHNLRPVLGDVQGINLGAVYENVVAQELKAHGHRLFYYDNRQKGEVDFLVDDYSSLSILPIEVKSGKDYTVHSALNNLLAVKDYHVASGLVLSNDRIVRKSGGVTYMPIYYVMFLDLSEGNEENISF